MSVLLTVLTQKLNTGFVARKLTKQQDTTIIWLLSSSAVKGGYRLRGSFNKITGFPYTFQMYITTIIVLGNTPLKRTNMCWKVTVIQTYRILKHQRLKLPPFAEKKSVEDCEEDEQPNDSEDADDSPFDEYASGPSKGKKRKKRMSSFELSEIIVTKGMKTRTELLAYANKQKSEGKNDIAEFIVNRGPRVVSEVLTTAWEMRSAQEKLDRSKKSRLEILEEAAQGECVSGCNGQWLTCACEVLEQNGICKDTFTNAIKELLERGHSKFRNVMICGPANSAKTFLLNPLTSVYRTFCNPASTSFAWVGAEEAECIFLNDFRWSQQIIQWHDFLLMLEGQLVHLPAPKTHYARDIVFEKDTPIFCTGKQPFVYIKNCVIDQREMDMMSVRWKIFYFNVQIQQDVQKEIPKCSKCFATFVLR